MLRCGGRSWSASELAAAVATAARSLRGPEHRVLLLLRDPAAVVIWLLAAERVGAPVAVGDASWAAPGKAAAAISARLVVTDDGVAERPGPDLDPSDIGWITFTSGSTGAPRALARSRQSWTASFPAFTAMTGLAAGDRVLVPGPLHSSLFCFAAVHALTVGAIVTVLPRWTVDGAAAALAQADVVHLVPAMLPGLLGARPAAPAPRLVVCAGAKLHRDLELAVQRSWAADVLEYYGSSEQSFVAARRGGDPTTVGTAFPGVEISIRDGEIWSRSAFGGSGYLGAGGGALRRDGDWLTVGDLGALSAGRLTVHGRSATAIVTGGVTVLAEDVEAVLRHAPGVHDVCVVGLPDDRLGALVVALLELTPGARVHRRTLRAFAAAALDTSALPRRWYVLPTLPRTASGKPARAAAAAALATGTLEGQRLGQ